MPNFENNVPNQGEAALEITISIVLIHICALLFVFAAVCVPQTKKNKNLTVAHSTHEC